MNEVTVGASAPDLPAAGRLKGRRVVVTGAASGIGRVTAQLFGREGASLALFDRDERGLAQTADETGGHPFVVDITREDGLAKASERAAAALGGLDGIVNAAGIMPTGSMLEVPVDLWRRTLEVNMTGTYLVIRSCLPWMEQEPMGTVVNVASAAGLLPNMPGLTAYAASKGAVVNFGRALAAELAPRIRVNTVCPGLVDTPMGDNHRANVGNYALKRMADPIEIARAILYLTSTESSYTTGATLATDGGRSFH
jgi:NAD(P)-dependent dehydrogenase (short-subunit alcohol dehydrogenase family)